MKLGKRGLLFFTALMVSGPAFGQDAAESASGKVFPAGEQMVIAAALWEEDGKPMIARGDEAVAAAPADAVHVTVTVYGASGVRAVSIPGGSKFMPPPNTKDTVVYLATGRLTANLGGTVTELMPGDVLQKSGSAPNVYEFHEDSVIIEHYVPSPTK
jgi:hypothetical protein